MPTATEIHGSPAVNVGSLPTTWTAAASCTSDGALPTALAQTILDDTYPLLWARESCNAGYWDDWNGCWPSAKEFGSIVTSMQDAEPSAYNGGFLYHSPGAQCPEGWTTVGTAAKDDDGELETSGAVLFETPTGDADVLPMTEPHAHAFARGLDDSETAVWCCPDGYRGNLLGGCLSTVSAESVTFSRDCREQVFNDYATGTQTWTKDDEPVTATIVTFEGELSLSSVVETVTMDPEYIEDNELTAFVEYPMITFAYSEGDNDGDDGDDGDDNEGDDDGNENDDDDDDEGGDGGSAASDFKAAGIMAAVVGAAGAVGALLL